MITSYDGLAYYIDASRLVSYVWNITSRARAAPLALAASSHSGHGAGEAWEAWERGYGCMAATVPGLS